MEAQRPAQVRISMEGVMYTASNPQATLDHPISSQFVLISRARIISFLSSCTVCAHQHKLRQETDVPHDSCSTRSIFFIEAPVTLLLKSVKYWHLSFPWELGGSTTHPFDSGTMGSAGYVSGSYGIGCTSMNHL